MKDFKKLFIESDVRRKGLSSRGKQPRLTVKVLNNKLSDKNVPKWGQLSSRLGISHLLKKSL